MRKTIGIISVLSMLIPVVASAHAHASYQIGGKQYDIVIGSLNEPIVVDDKTGLELTVTSGGRMEMAEDGDMEPAGGKPATGLEKDLKVELIAGDKRMTQDISPVFGAPGSYKTTFYPTVATTFSYRLFGTINKTPVNLIFTCLPAGSEATEEEEKDISSGLKQLMKGGAFSCPSEKASLGFPENSASIVDLNQKGGNVVSWGAAALGLAALVIAFSRRRTR